MDCELKAIEKDLQEPGRTRARSKAALKKHGKVKVCMYIQHLYKHHRIRDNGHHVGYL
jgi:hypothetical protein